ncbi:MAG: PLP-dependent aminotransferase family protein [Hyphomicrobiaceae bacterium]
MTLLVDGQERMKLKSPWTPRLDGETGLVSDRLTAALVHDIADGRISAGARLPAHRELAYALGIGTGTVTKAYLALERRGLVRSVRGRGMFVAGVPERRARMIDLSINVPPEALSDRLLAKSLETVARRLDARTLSTYQAAAGRPEHRRCLAAWLSSGAAPFDPENVLITHGAQHALAIAFGLVGAGATMLTEEVTYPGALQLAGLTGLRCRGVAMDDEGMAPRALGAALRAVRGHAFVYVTPSLHNPTGCTQSLERRREIARVCRQNDVLVVEDEIYSPLLVPRVRPLAALMPERTLHVTGLSKVLCPGLRIGALVVPEAHRAAALRALEATASMSSALSGTIMQQWLEDGTARDVIASIRHEGERRQAAAAKALGQSGPRGRGFHLFLPMALAAAEAVAARCAELGVVVTPPCAVMTPQARMSGLRLCLGGPPMADLEEGLQQVAAVLREASSGTEARRRAI